MFSSNAFQILKFSTFSEKESYRFSGKLERKSLWVYCIIYTFSIFMFHMVFVFINY